MAELPFSPVAGNILQLARDERRGAREIARIIAQGARVYRAATQGRQLAHYRMDHATAGAVVGANIDPAPNLLGKGAV